MSEVFEQLINGSLDYPDVMSVTIRLCLATLLGAVLGFERSLTGKQAGMRTHMLVSLGSALFVMAAVESGASADAVTRVIQGTATGIGFVGAGAILKVGEENRVRGLTTAANIWLTAAIGTAVGVGRLYLPTLGVILAWFTLSIVERLEARIERKAKKKHAHKPPANETSGP
ncbi:MAG: MgtC/SapB family protein [Pirellulales bacterium]|nr:MgtC/SapB family protein [Pirellulales bacterium]